jgi:signal transduction histidine kinase
LIYRIVQEAVNNILKHAKATEAIVQLSINDTILSLTIEDNGIGFDTAIFSKTGMGLMNLQSRTMNLGGTFEISSLPNSGTTIFLEFDVKLFILNPDQEAINLKAKSFSTPIKPEAF